MAEANTSAKNRITEADHQIAQQLLKLSKIKLLVKKDNIYQFLVDDGKSDQNFLYISFDKGKPNGFKFKRNDLENKLAFVDAALLIIEKEEATVIDKSESQSSHLEVSDFISDFNSLFETIRTSSIMTSIDYRLLLNKTLNIFDLSEDIDQINGLFYVYSKLRSIKKNNEADASEFTMRLVRKLSISKNVYVTLGVNMFTPYIKKEMTNGAAFVIRNILMFSKYPSETIDSLITFSLNRANPDLNIFLSETIDCGLLNQQQLLSILKVKNISSFYISKACIYAIDNDFEEVAKLFITSRYLTVLDFSCHDALSKYLIKKDKEMAKKFLRTTLESRPRYSTYRLYCDLLSADEKAREKDFFEAVANVGGFLGALHLENGLNLSETELKDLTPEQANNLSGELKVEEAKKFANCLVYKINKLLQRKVLPSETGEWLILLYKFDRVAYETFLENPKIKQEVIHSPSFRRFLLLSLDKDGLLKENGLYRYLG